MSRLDSNENIWDMDDEEMTARLQKAINDSGLAPAPPKTPPTMVPDSDEDGAGIEKLTSKALWLQFTSSSCLLCLSSATVSIVRRDIHKSQHSQGESQGG